MDEASPGRLPMSGPLPDGPSLVRDELLHELFEATADARPRAAAVLRGPARLAYRELDERANRLARCLRARGVRREDRVAVLLPRSELLYVAVLAALKAGAAYVPIDRSTPPDRVRFILEDCGARLLLTLEGLYLGDPGVPVLLLDAQADEVASFPSGRLSRSETGASPESLCYVIYTSGTTGRPKGVQIEHRNATHLVRSESLLYGVVPEDRVCQLASIAFDASVEEIWLAFFHGATLVPATEEMLRAGPELSRILADLGVTVLSCVPTFLSMLEEDIPSLRLLIFGGEACPPGLAARWHRPGRKVFNTYGPTEATVIATAALLDPSRPLTIGAPVAGYEVLLTGEDGLPVPEGRPGEICIGGPGVSRGYLNRPELQALKFVELESRSGRRMRFYKTGDLGRWTAGGELEYLGRNDDQVKVRGFRIELSEIEAALADCPGVLAAAAAVHPASQRIAAFVVPRSGASLDRAALRAALASRLPPYMLPAFLDEVQSLPRTTAGKIDRKALPEPRLPLVDSGEPGTPPRTEAERAVVEAFRSALGREVSVEDDFFLDLDGHSLLAALAVSKLRSSPGFERLSVRDLYAHPSAEALARLCRTAEGRRTRDRSFQAAPAGRFAACAAGQAAGVLVLGWLYAWQWLGPFFTYGYLAVADTPIPEALAAALLVYVVTTPLMLALSIALKWLLLGRLRPGLYPLWGWTYWRFWLVRAVTRAVPMQYLAGTPLLNLYYRLMGARIGRDVFLGSYGVATFDLLSIGDGASVGSDVSLDGASVEDGMLRLSTVTLGRGCWVGSRCSLGGDTALEDGAGLDDLSCLLDGQRVPAGELWRGSPARPAGRMEPVEARPPWSAGTTAALLTGVFVFPFMILAAIFPGLMLIVHQGHMDEGFSFLVATPLVALSFVVLLGAEIWAFKWLLLGRLKEGRYPVAGAAYVRLWFFNQLMQLSLEVIGTLYSTLYLRPWLKALGARLGPRSEIATIRLTYPDLLEAGSECFLADDVMVAPPRVRGGWLAIGRTRVGDRTFVGNSALLPAGSVLGGNVLVGTLSIAPGGGLGSSPAEGESWFGSPPIRMPARARHRGFSEAQTYRPARGLVALRLCVEFFRVLLPSMLFIVLASLIMNATDVLQDYIGIEAWLAALAGMYVAAGVLAVAMTALLKALLIGRYRKGETPLWSGFVWRTELLTGVYENLCVLFFLDLLRGTPFMAWALRALGMRVGSRCYIDTTWFTEFDLVEIGDEAALNEDANIQTHLFEDRVMKTGAVRLGPRCSVGTMSTVLYDTEVGEGASLGELSLLMKGEALPKGTSWQGIPAG